MKPDAETRMDGILKRVMPLILFSYDIHRKPLIEKVGHLYGSFVADDSNTFEELFIQITEIINNREILDSNRERLIESFSNITKTYDERIREHDEMMTLFKKARGMIITNRQYINKIKNQIKKIEEYQKKFDKNKYEKPIGEKKKSAQKLISVEPIEKTCPHCNYVWGFTGKGSRIKNYIRIQCPKCKQFFKEKVIG